MRYTHVIALILVPLMTGIFTFGVSRSEGLALDIQVVTSKTGVTAWLVEDHRLPIIDISFVVRRGMRHDPDGKHGAAALMTYLLDEGAGTYSDRDFAEALEDKTIQMSFEPRGRSIMGKLRTLSEHKERAIELFRLAINAPRFDPEPLGKVREQLISGFRQELSNADEQAMQLLFQSLFEGSPFARRGEGTEASLKELNADDIRQFHKQAFTREKLIVAVVGDIDAETLTGVLDQLFGDLPETSPLPDIDDPDMVNLGTFHKKQIDVPQSSIRFALPGPAIRDEDYYATNVLNYLLGGSTFNSRLFMEIREKRGLAYSVGSSLSPLRSKGLLLGYAGVGNESVDEAIRLITSEIKRLASGDITPEEVDMAKQYIIGTYDLAFTSNAKIAGQLIAQQLFGLPIDYRSLRNNLYEKVTVEDVRRVAQRYLMVDPIIAVAGG